jgi:hypothetical protein
MPANPLLQSIQSAIRMNETLGSLFSEAGSIQEGTGYVVRAYRNANRALPQALQEVSPTRAVRDIMHELRVNLGTELRGTFDTSFQTGLEESGRQLRYYGIETDPKRPAINLSEQVNSAVNAVIAQVDAQEQTLNAMLMSNIDTILITGDEDRQGVLKPAEILTGATYWIAALVWDAFSWWSSTHSNGEGFSKQSIAALDGRTTDCCIRVHGQIKPLNGKFHLTGTPRFADDLEWAPFHWNCRTSIALYSSQFDDGLTDRMRAGANWLQAERLAGRNPDQHPADAFWN